MNKNFVSNTLISSLSSHCSRYPRQEKVLIVPDYRSGRQVLERLARSGTGWINFRLETLSSLALGIAGDRLASGELKFINSIGVQAIIDSIFNELADSKKLKYFEKHPVNKGMVEALSGTIQDLRIAGVKAIDLKPGVKPYAIKKEKENDIYLILLAFEETLKESNLIDRAGVISLAIESLDKKEASERMFFIQPRFYMSGIERKFIEKLCGDSLVILGEDPVYGLNQPKDAWQTKEKPEESKVETDIERLKWLFDADKAPKAFNDGSIEIFSAVGHRNEIREILRRVMAGKVPVDDVEIVCAGLETYADSIYSLCEKLGIPVTFSSGVPAYVTSAGRTLMGFLLWIKEDFNEIYLRRIFEANGLNMEDKKEKDFPGSSVLAHLLRTSGVGWGRDRYSLMLSSKIEEYRINAEEARKEGEDGAEASYKKKAKNLEILKNICADILSLVPAPDKEGRVSFKEMCSGCVKFLDKYARATDDKDAAVIKSAKEHIEMLGDIVNTKILFEEAAEKLINIASGIRIMPSAPRPGSLHVSHYRSGGVSGRPHTFITGLDESRFQAKTAQDPILLDNERQKISSGLELSSDQVSRDLFDMASLVSGLRGKVVFSYPAYDLREERKSFPSSVLLQVFRVKEGAPEADYNRLLKELGEPIGFKAELAATNPLDETDWWLSNLIEGEVLKDGIGSIQNLYPGVKEGIEATQKRQSDVLTEFDGKIDAEANDIDPRMNKGLIMSASRLENAAGCPFRYFVRYVLRVEPIEETEKDVTAWLDPKERGSLLHEVFEKFTDEFLIKKKEEPDEEKHAAAINGVLDAVIEEYKKNIPPPSGVIFSNEVRQLKRDVIMFLRLTKDLKTRPVMVEVNFGGEKELPAKVIVGEGESILVRGRIDRIDKAGESEYHVWDYKTGSSYNYEENKNLKNGQQLQHCLYSIVAEELLKKKLGDTKAKVTKAGYIFPTEKGIGGGKDGIMGRDPSKVKWQEALRIILDIIGKGVFTVGDKDACAFCEYGEICDRDNALEQIKMKSGNPGNTDLLMAGKIKEKEYE